MAELLTEPDDLSRHLRRSALAGPADTLSAADITRERAVTVREVPFLTMVSVRAEPRSAAHAIGDVLGAPLPDRARSTGQAGEHTTLWLAPDEWLVMSTAPAAVLVARLSVALGHAGGDIVEVSANRTTIELAGPSVRAVLGKGCPADLHPSAFPVGSAVTNTLGPVPLLLWRTGEGSWRLLPHSSLADYVARWLLDAMTEFSLPEVP